MEPLFNANHAPGIKQRWELSHVCVDGDGHSARGQDRFGIINQPLGYELEEGGSTQTWELFPSPASSPHKMQN